MADATEEAEAVNYEYAEHEDDDGEGRKRMMHKKRSTYLLSEGMAAVRLDENEEDSPSVFDVQQPDAAPAAAAAAPAASPRAVGAEVTQEEIEKYAEEEFECVTLHARTLAGDSVTIPDIPRDIIVSDLKHIIAAQLAKFPYNEQKLILKGKTMSNDDAKLDEYGVKDNDTIHVVRKLSGSADPEQLKTVSSDSADLEYGASSEVGPAIAAAERQQVFDVLVPPGRRAGDRLRINLPERGAMVVVVPPGYSENMTFKITVAPQTHGEANRAAQQNMANARARMQRERLAAEARRREEEAARVPGAMGAKPVRRQTNPFAAQPRRDTAHRGGPPQPRMMEVTVPADAGPGQAIDVLVGRTRMRVVVPRNVGPGQAFRFRLPD